ncbi:MAG: polyprenyl synthetase family protein [Candidatus Omnitrophica bacterium]|nr:polyprenyl synthetase family protein [Candidatus Omnitrophota bacterium]
MNIKKRIDQELAQYLRGLDTTYRLSSISSVLHQHINNFLLRKGKRVRPILFVLGYLGYAKKPAKGLLRSALSLELLHDFMLIHDDIIDKSETRRGQPSMHTMLETHLRHFKNLKFNGQDLAIVIGDVVYALALHAFLAIKENKERKEQALKKLIEAAIYTGSGEFVELLYGTQTIDTINKKDIFKIYDLKTANYTFASPLVIGATLAGASAQQKNILFQYGIYLGRAFQIKDDIIGMFSEEQEMGKLALTDLREAKKTILILKAFANADTQQKSIMRSILAKKNAGTADLLTMRRIITATGALAFAKSEVTRLIRKAQNLHQKLTMKPAIRSQLGAYTQAILDV